MDRWTPNEAAIQAEEAKNLKAKSSEAPLGHNPHRDPKVSSVTTAGSSDYVRLRGLREQGYYILYDD
jgi:hypothetical protein